MGHDSIREEIFRVRSFRDLVLHSRSIHSPLRRQLVLHREFSNSCLHHNARPAYPNTELELIQEWEPVWEPDPNRRLFTLVEVEDEYDPDGEP